MKTLSHYLVGIGASAGGLAAIKALVQNIETVSVPVSYVICQHLAPDKKSYMKDILADIVQLPLKVIESGTSVERDTIYLSPPGKQAAIIKGRFVLSEIPAEHTPTRSIDFFFRSIAHDYKSKSIGVILSGSGSDGVKGCQDIYEVGGEVFVQEPSEAEFPSMPESAINSGYFTKAIAAKGIFQELKKCIEDSPSDQIGSKLFDDVHSSLDGLAKVLGDEFGLNIRDYKFATVCRRIAKRLQNLNIESSKKYLDLLNTDPKEKVSVLSEILISVTSFFRDADFYESLKKIIDTCSPENKEEFRVWSAGCSHGEEAYSILMLVKDSFDRRGLKNSIKLFATDVNGQNLDIASRGFYSNDAVQNIPIEFRSKYFDKVTDGYCIKKSFREMVIFSRHDLLQSPPFSGMDLVVCRNLLIYFSPTAQSKSLVNLVFSLRVNGILALGPSESLGYLQKYFDTLDRKWRLFKKERNTDSSLNQQWRPPRSRVLSSPPSESATLGQTLLKGNPIGEVFNFLYPDSLIISEDLDICAIFGRGRTILKEQTDGLFTPSIDSLVQDSVNTSLRSAIAEAKKTGNYVQVKNVIVELDKEPSRSLDLTVSWHARDALKGYYLCVIGTESVALQETIVHNALSKEDVVASLRAELDQTRIDLQEAVTELELTNEELQTSNEELIASNEELQSTNEELSSVNEELYTLNGELQQKIDQISLINDDLKNLINTTQVGVIFLDKKCLIRRITPIVEDRFFIRTTDLGRSIFELDFGNYLEKIKNQLRQGQVLSYRAEIQSKSGETHLCSINPYYDDHSEHKGHVISLVNVTESIEREQLLNETQADAKIGGWILDLRTKKTKWTRQVYSLFELSPEIEPDQAMGISHYSKKDREQLAKNISDCSESGKSFEGIYALTAEKGKFLWVRVSGHAICDPLGKPYQVRGTIQDITENRFLSERMNLALVTAQIGIWDWNISTDSLFWDSQMKEIYGYKETGENLKFPYWKSVIHSEDAKSTDAAIHKAVTEGVLFDHQFRIMKGTEIRHVRASGKVFHDLTGKPIRMIGIGIDNTEQIQVELNLAEQQRTNFQNAKMISIGELAAGVGHEINNPLAILMGNFKLLIKRLEQREQLTPDIMKIFKIHESAAIRIRDIVNGLRTFARSAHVEMSPYSADLLVQKLIELIREIYTKSGIDLVYSPPQENFYIFVNFSHVQQALMNLLSNARDALGNQKIKRIEVEIKKNKKGEIEISVIDTGTGIPSDKLTKIFDTFYTTKPVGEGTGLGLSLSKKMIEESRGRIEVESQLSVGSCFKLIFPEYAGPKDLKDPRPENNQPSVSTDISAGKNLKKLRILLVEDEELLRPIIKDLIEELGHQVVDVASAKASIQLLMTEKFDFLVTDLQMPEMNGIELIIKIKDELKLDLPCILATGDPTEDRIALLRRGSSSLARGILRKPFELDEMKAILMNA